MRKSIGIGNALVYLDSIVSLETRNAEPLTLYLCVSSGQSFGLFFPDAIEKSKFANKVMGAIGTEVVFKIGYSEGIKIIESKKT